MLPLTGEVQQDNILGEMVDLVELVELIQNVV